MSYADSRRLKFPSSDLVESRQFFDGLQVEKLVCGRTYRMYILSSGNFVFKKKFGALSFCIRSVSL